MALTHSFVVVREQCFQQMEKLTKSHILHGSESLCKLLHYLAEHSLDHPGLALKEYQIATEVLGRPAGFDPQSDSTVRVQIGRLRVKLAEYYALEGVDDPVLVELPKGSYALTFHLRAPKAAALAVPAVPLERVHEALPPAPVERAWKIAVLSLSAVVVICLLTIAILIAARTKQQTSAGQAVPAAYQIFWSRFANSAQQPWVIFSNGQFVGRPETGMRYFNPASDARTFILDHYTGVGEVLAIHQLDNVFAMLNRPLRVKRGALFSLDDAKNNDLIFVGSPSENLTLLDIPGTREFVFERVDSGPRKGDLAVLNVHPKPGEPKLFLATPANQPTIEDYSVISLLPGLDPSHAILILAGNSTFGTQAAVEFVCREDSIKELLHELNVKKAGDLKPFEALLHVKIAHGVPVTTELISVRDRSN
ncbi:MAG: helix-turn-helix domain-containing protein [Candidatus Sulfotelmatobacter sp.]